MAPNNYPERRTMRPRAPRARVNRVLDTGLTDKILMLVDEFNPLPLGEVTSLYKARYGTYLDIYTLGLEDGVMGLFVGLKDSVDLHQQEQDGRWLVEPNIKRRKQISLIRAAPLTHVLDNITQIKASTIQDLLASRKQNRMHVRMPIFNPNNHYLWNAEFKSLLTSTIDYKIALSPYELAMMRHQDLFKQEIAKITATLRQHPQGVRLNNLYNLCTIRKNILSVASIEDATNQYPEIFYRVEPEVDGTEPLLYDGTTKTYDDLTGKVLPVTPLERYLLAYRAIASGIYQKTLILLRQAGMDGLKLSVWYESITNTLNFSQQPIRFTEHCLVLRETPLTFFLVLSSFGLIEIVSHNRSRNDLRVILPRKQLNWESFMFEITSKSRLLLRQSDKL